MRDLKKEYVEIGSALSDWFISQEIDPSKAAGAMSYLIGVIIGRHHQDKGASLEVGIALHQQIIALSAMMAAQ